MQSRPLRVLDRPPKTLLVVWHLLEPTARSAVSTKVVTTHTHTHTQKTNDFRETAFNKRAKLNRLSVAPVLAHET